MERRLEQKAKGAASVKVLVKFFDTTETVAAKHSQAGRGSVTPVSVPYQRDLAGAVCCREQPKGGHPPGIRPAHKSRQHQQRPTASLEDLCNAGFHEKVTEELEDSLCEYLSVVPGDSQKHLQETFSGC